MRDDWLRSGTKAVVVLLIVVIVVVGYIYPRSVPDKNAAQTANIEESEQMVLLNNTTHSAEFLIELSRSDYAEIQVEERTGEVYTQYNVTRREERIRLRSLAPGDSVCAVYMNGSNRIDRDCLPEQPKPSESKNLVTMTTQNQ